MNAITPEMDDLLAKAWSTIDADPDIWCAVVAAEGEQAFCIGADVETGLDRSRRMALGGGLTGIGGPPVTLRKPLVAAVQGFCVGGGFELAMCADIIVAANTAEFGLPETKVGIIGECGVVHRAIRQLPYHVAMGMILTGERLKADAALQFGLVNEVVAPDCLAEAVDRWTAKINRASPLANQAAKAAALGRLGYPLDVALSSRYELIEQYASSADAAESRGAIRDQRRPSWTGR